MAFQLALLFTGILVGTTAKTSVQPTKNPGMSKPQCNVNNNFYAGPHCCKKIEQQLTEIKEAIAALKTNQTGGSYDKVFKNCADVYNSGEKINGVYKIDPDGLGEFEVYCDQKTAGGGWTVFQKRQDGSVDFFRAWDAYKRGFGNLNGEFWLGLDKIHRLTVSSSNKLRVDLEDIHGNTAFAEYSSVTVASERAKYQLSLGTYSGTARDSLGYHRGQAFSTKDRDNDNYSANCASSYKGAWWYKSCHYSNLNGLYLNGKTDGSGMTWYYWKNSHYSVKRSEMKIRPQNF
ncbi:microfibril-associated glycoprotein 4-like [Montipora capricornis]|uniref:microfibril-associated glycoprotein 4-like n=1 Tax=Montipora capricornis TaxID=246305 RepID=UPI0035F1E9FA